MKSLAEHWNNVYLKTPDEKLGWFEKDLRPTMRLVLETGLDKKARILNVGAGNTLLIDELLKSGYSNLIAMDISNAALEKLKDRVGGAKLDYIVDDLTQPERLVGIDPVDLWIDRAVLHFFTEAHDQAVYFELLKDTVKPGGYAILAQFSLKGARICSGLPVFRYSREMLVERLEGGFELVSSFDHTYINPSGGERPYIYALFRKSI